MGADSERGVVLADMVRVGVVGSVDPDGRMARVQYDDTGVASGWLHVVQHNLAAVTVAPDNAHTHVIEDTYTSGGSASEAPAHEHPGTKLAYWMPEVGQSVLVLYIPVENGDGFILGGF